MNAPDLSFFAAAAECPDQIAVIDDGVPYTFAALRPAARDVLGWLAARGVQTSPAAGRVALVAENRLETVVLLYALIEAGVTAVLLHPRLTAPEREVLVRDCRPVLLVDRDCLDEIGARMRLRIGHDTGHEAIDHRGASRFAIDLGPVGESPAPPADERPLAMLYTSGTTGRPKGAVLSRAAFAASAAASAANLGWQADDRWLLCMPLAHVGGLSILTRCLIARRTVVMARSPRFDPTKLCRTLASDRVTLVSLVPTMLKRVLDLDPPPAPPTHLRAVLLGGASAPANLLERATEHGWPVLTTYGLTEACSQVTTQRYGTRASAEQGTGEPVLGMELRIVDQQIQVRGSSLMSGYFSPSEPSFLPDGWFPTGDLGYLDATGKLHLLSRRTDLIITGGENVYPLEVEGVLERCPLVAAACVFGVPDETWGQQVVAAVIPAAQGVGPLPDAVLAVVHTHVTENLAPHKRPRRFAVLAELPLNGSGKLDRQAAARLALASFGSAQRGEAPFIDSAEVPGVAKGADPADVMVQFRGVSYAVPGGKSPIVHDLDLRILRGEILVLLGESGCGKTTSLRLINHLIRPTAGQVLVEGKATTEWDPIQLRRHIGYVIQEAGLFPHFTVADNVALVPTLLGWDRPRVAARVAEMLDLVGLDGARFAGRFPSELSGGQRQRVGVARALAADPPLLLLDEPFGALDPLTRATLQREFLALCHKLSKTAVFVTHDVREALLLGSRIGLMAHGKLALLTTPAGFLAAEDACVSAYRDTLRMDAAGLPAWSAPLPGLAGLPGPAPSPNADKDRRV